MQKALLLCVGLGTGLYVLVASNMWGAPSFISIPFELMKAVYVPCAIAAGFGMLISFFLLIFGKAKVFYGSCFILCIPMVAYFLYRPEYFYMKGYKGDQKSLAEYREAPSSLLLALIAYHELHPERFHWTGDHDFVTVDGFGDFLKYKNPPITWAGLDPHQFQDNTSPIEVVEDEIRTPWGSPIRFLANTNGDFYVATPDGKIGSDLVNDPWRKPGSVCKIIVGAYTDTPAFSQRYFPTSQPHDIVTLNDVDYDEEIQTSGRYLHDRLTAGPNKN